jgi:hypothetical protein
MRNAADRAAARIRSLRIMSSYGEAWTTRATRRGRHGRGSVTRLNQAEEEGGARERNSAALRVLNGVGGRGSQDWNRLQSPAKDRSAGIEPES